MMDWNIGISVIQAIISGGTLWIAFLVYKKLIPSELNKRQLDAVLDLIQHLNTYTFNMYKKRCSGIEIRPNSSRHNRNIFEYIGYFSDDVVVKAEDKLRLFLLDEDTQPFNLTKYIENPLMPSSIVEKLSLFINPVIHKCEKQDLRSVNELFIFQENIKDCKDRDFRMEDLHCATAESLKSHSEFVKAIYELRKSIEEWCASHGLEDLNFREVNSSKNF